MVLLTILATQSASVTVLNNQQGQGGIGEESG
jgi:hypothetical protein